MDIFPHHRIAESGHVPFKSKNRAGGKQKMKEFFGPFCPTSPERGVYAASSCKLHAAHDFSSLVAISHGDAA
jgi:hypothetical protein